MLRMYKPAVTNQTDVTKYVTMEAAIPALIRSPIRMLMYPAATAFGGVPAGIMNAIEQLIAAGVIKNKGWTLSTLAISAKIGNKMLANVILDVNSVKMLATNEKISITYSGDITLRPLSPSRINVLRPVSLQPRDSAKPPPNRNIRPHGIFCCATFHVRSGVVGLAALELSSSEKYFRNVHSVGKRNRKRPIMKATVESLTFKLVNSLGQPGIKGGSRNVQSNKAKTNKIATLI